MRYLIAIVCIIACSSFVFETSIARAPTEIKKEIRPIPKPVLVLPVAMPKPKLNLNRNSDIECEWLTKICVSEGGFNYEECERILQTLENMRGTEPLYKAMRTQSSRITRQKPFNNPRQIWISYLPMSGTKPPSMGWVECKGKNDPKGCTGTWTYISKKWIPFREQVHALYYSKVVPNPIPGKPIQWGGDMDYWRGAGRNFCPLNNGQGFFQNTFWADPKDPMNEGKCLPIDKEKIKRSKILTESIARRWESQKDRIATLLGKKQLEKRD